MSAHRTSTYSLADCMIGFSGLVFNFLLVALASMVVSGEGHAARPISEIEPLTRLQVFLDRQGFSPGKIDGRDGGFTRKAIALYRQSRGEVLPVDAPAGNSANVDGLDLQSIDPVFVEYEVTEDDIELLGKMASTVEEQAKQESMPYVTAAELIAEKFHCDVDFLAELNPGKTDSIKAGDQLKVPNVEPFDLVALQKPFPELPAEQAANIALKIDVVKNMLSVFDQGQLVAAYPVTIGGLETLSPVGEWKVKGVARMPDFRYDKRVLKEGIRSEDFHILKPGPNNPVGVIWIALDKSGLGIHGTNEPDTIGRSASHGCVRLANWDVARLAKIVKTGVAVSIK
ncbi:L,D-transpeptidase family protein [Phragmitibacter flavus]|nr:L,D-transpeptidase family protein [Phragmitibacter flavus]